MDRASKLLERQWIGDIYSAARDYLFVVENWPDYEKAYLGLIECLVTLKWRPEAEKWIELLKKLIPEYDKTALSKLEVQLEVSTTNVFETENLQHFECSELEKELRINSFDFDLRYIGHCNTTTDIKEANYLGEALLFF